MGSFGRQEGLIRSRPWYSQVHLEMGLPGLTECTQCIQCTNRPKPYGKAKQSLYIFLIQSFTLQIESKQLSWGKVGLI